MRDAEIRHAFSQLRQAAAIFRPVAVGERWTLGYRREEVAGRAVGRVGIDHVPAAHLAEQRQVRKHRRPTRPRRPARSAARHTSRRRERGRDGEGAAPARGRSWGTCRPSRCRRSRLAGLRERQVSSGVSPPSSGRSSLVQVIGFIPILTAMGECFPDFVGRHIAMENPFCTARSMECPIGREPRGKPRKRIAASPFLGNARLSRYDACGRKNRTSAPLLAAA